MKKRFMTILLAGGLTLGLCGCGGSSGDSSPSEPGAQEETAIAEPAESALPEVWYTTDDLLEMWDAGTLTKEDVIEIAEAGEMNDGTFEEMMNFIAREEEIAAQSEVIPESESTVMDVNTAELLTTYAVEFEDYDGYKIRAFCQLSPIFTEDSMKTAYALWEALGNDATTFPSEESLYDTSYLLRGARDSDNCDKLEYIIGTYAMENLYSSTKLNAVLSCYESNNVV